MPHVKAHCKLCDWHVKASCHKYLSVAAEAHHDHTGHRVKIKESIVN